ncbi:MAG: alkaline phosphatase family protein [Nitrospirales bacterium]|nr:alkaline phosphatase family protein [Nitrospirales bacterium]
MDTTRIWRPGTSFRRSSTPKTLLNFFVGIGLLATMLSNPTGAWAAQANHVILIVLEGIKPATIQNGATPTLARLAKEGAVSWSAQSISPPLTVPSMASLLTGLTVERHRVNADWEHYDFGRSFMRSPTVFDYMDLAGGMDSAVFLMDERLYQLSRPEIYVDSQVCGYTKPQCNPERLTVYIKDYLSKVTSGSGYGFRIFAVPNLLLVHFPTAARIGQKSGWDSAKFQTAVQAIDTAVENIISIYKELGVLDQTMVIVTGLNSGPVQGSTSNGQKVATGTPNWDPTIPWIAWGANIKAGQSLKNPVSLLDTGATIMYGLGLETHTEWDSHPLKEIFQTVPERRTTENEELEKIY